MRYSAGSLNKFDPTAWLERAEDLREGRFPHINGECTEKKSLVSIGVFGSPVDRQGDDGLGG